MALQRNSAFIAAFPMARPSILSIHPLQRSGAEPPSFPESGGLERTQARRFGRTHLQHGPPCHAPGLEWSLLIQVTAANVPASRGTKCAKSPSAVASFIGGAEWVRVEHNRIGHISNGGIAVSQNVTAYPSPPSHDTLNWQSQLPMHLTRSKCV